MSLQFYYFLFCYFVVSMYKFALMFHLRELCLILDDIKHSKYHYSNLFEVLCHILIRLVNYYANINHFYRHIIIFYVFVN